MTSDNPIEGAVFNVVKDGQVIATEATDADGSIIVPNVTEGMYAFSRYPYRLPYAKLQQPVIAHVDQATVDGGGTVTVTAVDQMLPTLTIPQAGRADRGSGSRRGVRGQGHPPWLPHRRDHRAGWDSRPDWSPLLIVMR